MGELPKDGKIKVLYRYDRNREAMGSVEITVSNLHPSLTLGLQGKSIKEQFANLILNYHPHRGNLRVKYVELPFGDIRVFRGINGNFPNSGTKRRSQP